MSAIGSADDGIAPLHIAADRGNAECVNTLLAFDADINIANVSGATPLHWAARRGKTQVVRLLCSHGAKVNPKDTNNQTPLAYALKNNHPETVQALIELGGDINALKCQDPFSAKLATLKLDSTSTQILSLKQLCKISIRDHYRYTQTARLTDVSDDLREFLGAIDPPEMAALRLQ